MSILRSSPLIFGLTAAAMGMSPPVDATEAPPPPSADPDIAAMAAELASLRNDVESLSQALTSAKEEERRQLAAIATARADLELNLRREGLREAQLSRMLAELEEASSSRSNESDALMAPLTEAIASLEETIQEGLPYRTEDRLNALAEIKAGLEKSHLSPEQATSRVWQCVEDELKLSRENAIDRQILVIDGQEQLVDVARLGMVALYYRTQTGAVGLAERVQEGWSYPLITEPEGREQVTVLFDALNKQIRTGWFTLPIALLGESQP